MRVVQVVKTNIGATWAFNQAKWLHDNNVEIITILPNTESGMAERYKKAGMKVVKGDFSLPIKRPWTILSKVREIQKIIKQIKPELIHCHFVTNILMLRIALRKTNIPRLFQVPGPLHLESYLFRKGEIVLSDSNDYWAGACKKTCDIYRENGIESDKLFLAYYGNYDDTFEYSDAKKKLHEEYKLQENDFLVGMVSYFYKPKMHMLQTRGLKGHEDFIDAVKLAQKIHPEIVGIVVGGAWGNSEKYVEKVKEYARKKNVGRIIFTGHRDDIKEIYREFKIAIHPSLSENLGGASESLAAGVPTISTDVGGFKDIVIEGETGITVPAKDPKKLAQEMIKMIEDYDNAKRMAQKGKEIVEELLNIENTSKEVLSIYNVILDRKKK